MQSPPPPPPSPLLAAKKVDFRQLRDSMLCTIMRAAASSADHDDTHSGAPLPRVLKFGWMLLKCDVNGRGERVNRVFLSSRLRLILMSYRHLFSIHSVLPRFRSSFAKRAFATKIAIHTRTWTGGRVSRRRSPIRCIRPSVRFCARNALPHHARGTIEEERTDADGREDGRGRTG